MILLGVSMFIWTKTLQSDILLFLIEALGGTLTGVTFVFTGALGLSALIANGSSLKIGPQIRSITGTIRSILWATFTISIYQFSVIKGFPSPMLYFWGSFTVVEIYTSYRAILDVRYSK